MYRYAGWSDYGDTPFRSAFPPGTSWVVEEAACCLCGCLSAGPLFIFIGLIFALTAITDPRWQSIRQYNRDVSAWSSTNGGLAQFQSVFPAASLALELTGSRTPASLSVLLAAQSNTSSMDSSAAGAVDPIPSELWFAGALLPSWTAWPAEDSLMLMAPSNGVAATFRPAELQLVQCFNERGNGVDANCTQTGEASCELFYRVVRVPSSVGVELRPPRGCTGANGGDTAACASPWATKLLPLGCGSALATAAVPVPEQTWIDDLRSTDGQGGPAWCANWTGAIGTALPAVPSVSVRSALDPEVEGALLTGCTYTFGPTSGQLAGLAANLILFGTAVVAVSSCCLFALISRVSQQAARDGTGEASAFGGGGAYYGGGWSGYGT